MNYGWGMSIHVHYDVFPKRSAHIVHNHNSSLNHSLLFFFTGV